jgi:glutathione S-transferase
MTLTLYHGSNGSCAVATHIALEEAGADYTAVRLDFSKSEQKGAVYLAINPKARVPTLVADNGVLTETPALLLYIAQMYPKANLAPLDNPFALAKMQAFTNYLCSTVHPAHAHKFRGARWSDDPAVIEALKLKVPHNIAECFGIIEKEYLVGPWVMGEQFTVADPYLFILESWMEGDGVDIKKFSAVYDHYTRMLRRPSVQKVMALG